MAFTGFPVAGIEFYEQLAADNSRTFWQEHKGRYVEFVKTPMIELTEELSDYGPFHMFRPHNDLRFSNDQLARFRAAIDGDATGAELEALVADVKRRKYEIGAIGELKTAPRGYPKDHPRIELLRLKGLIATKTFGAPKWLHTKAAAGRIRETWEGVADLCAWLDAHVGPSTEPPGDRPF